MCVNPGWGSQSFIPSCREKVRRLKNWLEAMRLEIPISVDGGVKADNIGDLVSDGAEVLVIGSAIFSSADPGEAFSRMKQAAGGRARG
jgi:ribulose-phosphate 3-epimerase